MQETDTDGDRREYLSRLGTVLQLARRAARIPQTTAAKHLGMTPVSFTRWENGTHSISAYDLARLVRLYGLDVDADLIFNPPASRVEIKRRLGPIAQAATRAARQAVLRPLPDDEPADGDEP